VERKQLSKQEKCHAGGGKREGRKLRAETYERDRWTGLIAR
jgi:hypothetical protein